MSTRLLYPPLVLYAALLLTVGCYLPGLDGGFLFDDTINLQEMGSYGGVRDWESFKSFTLGGWSGPSGRPLSLMSFLLNDTTWPSQAARFKPTNLGFHLLCGLLLAWTSLLVLRFYGFEDERATWLATFSASCWLLHPFLVSTTLYVIQRMTQLAALFVFAGIVGYLHGRLILTKFPRAAYLWMAGSLTLGTLLAVLSKENGVLLPLLVGVIEFCAPNSTRNIRSALIFRVIFIWLPTLAVLGYLASNINFSPDLWPNRNFNQLERLLSEPRILWDYLGNLLLPRIEGQGLYHDDFVISRDLITPGPTLPALLGLLGLIVVALSGRRRWPLFSLAMLFFLVGHLLESTLLGLELYFEHRNYLPTAFLFLPIASGLDSLRQRTRVSIPAALGLFIIALLAFMTWMRSQLWADTGRLEIFWATTAINSPRAQNAVATYYMNQGLIAEANRHIEEAVLRIPDSSLLSIRRLLQKVWVQQATEADFTETAERLGNQPFDAQTVMALRLMVERLVGPKQPHEYIASTIQLLENLRMNAAYNKFPLFIRLAAYLEGQLYLAQGVPDLAYAWFSDAMGRYNETDAAIQMVALMANAGYQVEALRLLEQAETIFRHQPERTLTRSRTVYDVEFTRLRNALNAERKSE